MGATHRRYPGRRRVPRPDRTGRGAPRAALQPTPHEVLWAPIDIRFGPGRILQPDLMLFEGRVPNFRPLHLIPRLVVEVLSLSNVDYDRFAKRLAYAAAGVPEYWVADALGDALGIELF